MAATLLAETGIPCALIPGPSGIFDITSDGELLYSKHAQGRFPSDREILDLLS
ncbi:MAG: putative Rdx family selenoprotein [Myxococcota bacterium]